MTVQKSLSVRESRRERIEMLLASTGSIKQTMDETGESYERVRSVLHGTEQGTGFNIRDAVRRGHSRGVWRARCTLDSWAVRRFSEVEREDAVEEHLAQRHGDDDAA